MRGTLPDDWRGNASVGIIPAYAGNTCRWRRRSPPGRDHPRVCGEHQHVRYILAVRLGSSPRMRGTLPSRTISSRGSSPRMRGTPIVDSEVVYELGIIPAYAGNTIYRNATSISKRDHPRVCGEHAMLSGLCVMFADHPRVCGEHTGAGAANVTAKGSSPRMRGTQRWKIGDAKTRGIIPAYAGNTQERRTCRTQGQDHPRVCGEHSSSELMTIMSMGSSPRMRGTPHARRWTVRSCWIIPAYAGNTSG